MTRDEDVSRLADDLESLRTGGLSDQEFRMNWQVDDFSGTSSVIWLNLEHYLTAVDIRNRSRLSRDAGRRNGKACQTATSTGARRRAGKGHVPSPFLTGGHASQLTYVNLGRLVD